jgi:hypothetical protein
MTLIFYGKEIWYDCVLENDFLSMILGDSIFS